MLQMKEAMIIYEIMGPGSKGVSSLAYAIREAEHLLFVKKIPMDEIHVTRDIYPKVAERLKKQNRTIARQIERTGNRCWECMDSDQKEKYIGKDLKDIQAPRDMIFYLAFYSHFQKSFYQVLEEYPSLLFSGEITPNQN